jgi:hemolysin activation/secretion protein
VPGTIDYDLRVQDVRPLHGSLELNNDHSAETQELRLNASLTYSNLWNLGHKITARYIVSPQDRSETEIFAGSYEAPLWRTPWTLAFNGSVSNSNVGTLGGTSVLGNGFTIGVRANGQLPSSASLQQSVSLGADYKNNEQTTDLVAGNDESLPLDYPTLVGSYSIALPRDRFSLAASLTVTAALRGVGDADSLEFRRFRNGGLGNFVHARLDQDFTFRLPASFRLQTRFSGQLANGPLPTNEQFFAGGLDSGRGYFQAEASGDNGVAGGIEFSSPSLASWFGSYLDDLSLYAFADAAKLWVINALPEQADSFSQVSVGAGTRFRLFGFFSGHVVVGVPLMDNATTTTGDPKISFTVRSAF